MVCGKPPFRGLYAQALLYEIVHQEPEPLTAQRTGVPMELERIVGKCLTKDAQRRYSTAADLIVDLHVPAPYVQLQCRYLLAQFRLAPNDLDLLV